MKIYILLGLFFIGSMGLYSKSDPRISKLLKSVEANYTKRTIQLEFTYAFKSPESGEIVEKGKITFSDSYYLLDLPDQAIYFDGESQWTHFKDRKEIQITRSSLEESAFHPLKFLKFYKSDNFKSRIVQDDDKSTIIEFVPMNKGEEYHKVKIAINKNSKQLQSFEIFLKNGEKYHVKIKKQLELKSMSKKEYQLDLDKYKDLHIEDLR